MAYTTSTYRSRNSAPIPCASSPALLTCSLLLLGLTRPGMATADEFPPYPEDPLSTRALVSTTSSRAVTDRITGDPCGNPHPPSAPWILVDVIDQALCHNPQTRQIWASARVQAAQLGVAEAAYLPSLNVTTALSRSQNSSGTSLQNPVQSFGTGGGSFSSSSSGAEQTRFTSTISMNYLLFDFGGRAAKLENAREALRAANWTQAATLQNVLFSAVQAYYQLFAARASQEAAEAQERSNLEALKAAALRYEVGSVALADKLQAQTALAQAQVNRQKAAGDASIALGTLANVMGLIPEAGLRIDAPALDGPDGTRDRDVQTLIEQAKASRPDLAAAEAQIQAAQAGVRTARAASLPSLSLVGNYSYTDSSSSAFSNLQSWSVGLQVSVPLFTGFANTYQIRGAEQQVEVQQANRDRLDQSVALEVWRAYYNLNTARETLHSTENLLASATQSEKVALGRYQAGAGNIIEVLNAEATLANARFQRVQSQYNWRIGKAQLAQALGRLDAAEAVATGSRRDAKTPWSDP